MTSVAMFHGLRISECTREAQAVTMAHAQVSRLLQRLDLKERSQLLEIAA